MGVDSAPGQQGESPSSPSRQRQQTRSGYPLMAAHLCPSNSTRKRVIRNCYSLLRKSSAPTVRHSPRFQKAEQVPVRENGPGERAVLRLLPRQSALVLSQPPSIRLLALGRAGVLRLARVLRCTGILGGTGVRRAGVFRCAWVLRRTGVRSARIHSRGRTLGGTRRTGIGRKCRSCQSQAQGAGAQHRCQWAAGGGVRFAFQFIRHFGSSNFS